MGGTYEKKNRYPLNHRRRSRFVEIANAQQAILLVRHAEDQRSKQDLLHLMRGTSALLLASVLKDASIKTIYTSSLQRTIDTAAPLAKALQIEPKVLLQLTTKCSRKGSRTFLPICSEAHGKRSCCLSDTQYRTGFAQDVGTSGGEQYSGNRVRQPIRGSSKKRGAPIVLRLRF